MLKFFLFITNTIALAPQTKLVSKTIDSEGQYVAVYNYTAIDSQFTCTETSKCFGWAITGQYKVVTDIGGASRLELTGTVKSPYSWASGGIVGMAWSFPFETTKQENEQVLL